MQSATQSRVTDPRRCQGGNQRTARTAARGLWCRTGLHHNLKRLIADAITYTQHYSILKVITTHQTRTQSPHNLSTLNTITIHTTCVSQSSVSSSHSLLHLQWPPLPRKRLSSHLRILVLLNQQSMLPCKRSEMPVESSLTSTVWQ